MSTRLSIQIKALRESKGLSQNELADQLGVGQSTVANYERGLRVPNSQKLQQIADLFEVSVDFLLGRESNSSPSIKNQDSRPATSPAEERKEETQETIPLEEVSKIFLRYLLDGAKEEAGGMIESLLDQGVNIRILYYEVLSKALHDVGTLWGMGVVDVWQEHYITEVVLNIMHELKAKARSSKKRACSAITLTPGAELHNVGIRMMSDLLELEGWEVTYIGSNVPVQSLLGAIGIKKPDVIAISVTMPYHIEAARNTITAIKNHFSSKAPKIIVGGGAFINSSSICEDTGADYYGVSVDDIIRIVELGGI